MKSLNIGDLHIPVPIIQGGMGVGISLSGLASAVANMGGIGVISTVGIGSINNENSRNFRKDNIEALRNEIRKAREATKGVLGVNIMSVITNFSDMVKTSIEEGIDIIFSGAGLPLDLPNYLENNTKTKLVPIVSSARAAKLIANKWKQNYNYLPDALVVEGPLAGGHLGFKPEEIFSKENELELLVKEVVQVASDLQQQYGKDIPVFAGGGLKSGKDIYNIFKFGARGAQIGTRFIATNECDASEEFKKCIVNSTEKDIVIIKSPVGMPGRAVKNKFLEEAMEGKRRPENCRFHCIRSCDPDTTLFCIANALLAASKGDMENGFVFTGSGLSNINEIQSVRKVFEEILDEYNKVEESHM